MSPSLGEDLEGRTGARGTRDLGRLLLSLAAAVLSWWRPVALAADPVAERIGDRCVRYREGRFRVTRRVADRHADDLALTTRIASGSLEIPARGVTVRVLGEGPRARASGRWGEPIHVVLPDSR